jgi:hypothetical protein
VPGAPGPFNSGSAGGASSPGGSGEIKSTDGEFRIERIVVVAARRAAGGEERVYVRVHGNGWVAVMREGMPPLTVRGIDNVAAHLPRGLAEAVIAAARAALSAERGAAPRASRRREPLPLRASAVAGAEELRHFRTLRYVPLARLESALGRDALARLEGGVPVLACSGRRGVLVDLEALLSYAEAGRALGDIAAPRVPRELARDLEVLERHGLVKRHGGVHVMPRSALALFPLSEGLLRSVVFVPDAVYRGIPGHGVPGGGEGAASARKAVRGVQ